MRVKKWLVFILAGRAIQNMRRSYSVKSMTANQAYIPWDFSVVMDQFKPDPNAKVSVWHGAKEPNMKKALEKLRRAFPSMDDMPFDGMGHGDIIGHPEIMAEGIKKFMER